MLKFTFFRVLFLLFAFGTITVTTADDGFFDGFIDFIDTIGDYVENIDFSSTSSTETNRGSNGYKYSDHNWLDTYFSIRLIDSLFYSQRPANGFHAENINISYQPTLADIILKHSLIAVTAISFTAVIIFLILDIIKKRSFHGTRLLNLIILWGVSVVLCLFTFFVFHVMKLCWIGLVAFWPYFWPYFLGITMFLFCSYCIMFLYRKSGIRIVREHEHIV